MSRIEKGIETLSIRAHLKGIDNAFQMAYYKWH